ncbi:excalibur calcium-binding domain-containing protein [Sphingomonas sp. JC676]|nr:excalibur calcium-binding domain-containing protein [Sphingomonas sp. JC676]
MAATVKVVGVASGIVRRRAPQEGDHWGGCNEARAAGTAPIYQGEPGYRDKMDGDGDGIACEPYHGQ